MGNFTKKKLRKPKEIIKSISKGKLSLFKREFSLKNSKKTVKILTNNVEKVGYKVDELKIVHNRLFNNRKIER